jgi:5-methylcytosine-specific restriction protein A
LDGAFRVSATVRDLDQPNSDQALATTCREVIVPLMAAMAELIGYDVIGSADEAGDEVLEGAVLRSVVRRRERNPRNRLLCMRIHGERCVACGLEPRLRYGAAGGVIEVHHLQPLSTLGEPRAYDPQTDLVPLCPTCHRAAHTKRPLPYTPEELRSLMGASGD